jgi:serine/threonine protein kinase
MSRDMKLQNALLEPQLDGAPLVKLCDFGYSKHEEFDSAAKTCVGTVAYIAPGGSADRLILAEAGARGQAVLHV